MHVRSPHAEAAPLVLLHGWPGSFLEFDELVGPLTDPVAHGSEVANAFDAVIHSHPGFRFSTPLEESGWTVQRTAAAHVEPMTRVGYDRFAVQGRDYARR